MSSVMQVYDYSPELLDRVEADMAGQAARRMLRQMIGRFDRQSCAIKVKHIFPDRPCAYYRVLFFLKKSAETAILNIKTDFGRDGVVDGMVLQLRISNKSSLEQLDQYTERIRDQILNAGDCRHCSPRCEGKRYTFSHHGKEYVKCQFLCSNFRFKDLNEQDIPDIMAILDGEFAPHASRRPAKEGFL